MKLGEIAEIIRGVHLLESEQELNKYIYKELSMLSLEPISFLDDRKVISVNSKELVPQDYFTQVGDVIVSLYMPMIACYVEEGQEGYVVPHHMGIIRLKPYLNIDSRFIVHFINSARGRRLLLNRSKDFSSAKPTSLPLVMLSEVELLAGANNIMDRF